MAELRSGREKEHEEGKQRAEFSAFPYTPYAEQLRYMHEAYASAKVHNSDPDGNVAVLESPTGTGKTLSILVGVLSWLEEHIDSGLGSASSDPSALIVRRTAEPDWIRQLGVEKVKRKRNEKEQRRKERLQRKRREFSESFSTKHSSNTVNAGSLFGRVRLHTSTTAPGQTQSAEAQERSGPQRIQLEDELFLPEEDETSELGKRKQLGDSATEEASAFRADSLEVEDEEPETSQLIYCSRTHSQLSQVLKEFKKTRFRDRFKALPLAGRKQLCVNPDVLALGSASRINEACVDMQRPSRAKRSSSGSYRNFGLSSSHRSQVGNLAQGGSVSYVADEALEEAMDVEELAAKGGELNGCAYYAARRAAQQAEILLMPYSSLLHEETRKLLGVRLSGSVIVLDEAHNVGEAVSASYSAAVTQHHLEIACSALKNYIDRFRSRLGPSNLRHLSMLYEVASCLQRTIESSSSSIMEGLYDFVKRAEIHNIDVFRLTNFVRESKILLKLSNYGEYVEDSNLNSKDEEASALSALQSLTSFISALGSSESDGRILIELNSCEEKTQRQLKYLLVDSSSRFVSLASDARAIIFAGGTLSPTEALLNQLVPNIRASRVVRTLTCGHIVPDGNLLCCALASGPTGYSLNFSFKRRDFQATDELGRVVLNMCKIAPGGIVVFLPSFQYMQSVIERWHSNGTISAVKKHKNLHWEPRSASEVEQTLSSHASDANESHHGALLLCVVGAKLSEGVNFADATGRCIILAGLPYPSPNDVELRERMRFHDELKRKANDEGRPDASELPSGRDLYESLCSRAVNQAVGRAIRHVNDWAAVVLADERFAASEGDGARSRLSDWMAKSLKVPRTFGEFCRVSAAFFKGKRTKGENVSWVH